MKPINILNLVMASEALNKHPVVRKTRGNGWAGYVEKSRIRNRKANKVARASRKRNR